MCVMNTVNLFGLTQTLRVIRSYLSISSTSKLSDEQYYMLKFYIPISNKIPIATDIFYAGMKRNNTNYVD